MIEGGLRRGDFSPDLPVGTDADSGVGPWENGRRLCWSYAVDLPDHLSPYDIRAVVEQSDDGSLENEAHVYCGDLGWSATDTRSIALALLKAADLGDQMANR